MHGLFEVDGVQNFQLVAEMQKHFPTFGDDAALRDAVVKIEKGNVTHFLR